MSSIVTFDHDAFPVVFGRSAMLVTHALQDEPLLDIDAIAELASELPQTLEFVEHHLGNAGVLVPDGGGSAPRLHMSGAAIVQSLENNGSRMSLRHIEQIPRYRELMDRVVDQVATVIPSREGRMRQREGFVFANSPKSITPLHTDPEHNFLLQTLGTKTLRIGTFSDRSSLDRDLERQYRGGHHYLTTMPDVLTEYSLRPGTGIYIPPHVPHMVENGDDVSVSLSVTFRTAATKRGEDVYRFNSRLRRLHISPRAPGGSVVIDTAKAIAMRNGVRAARLARRLRRS